MANYTIQYNQTFFDLLIKTTGDFDNAYGLILSNSGLTNIESAPQGLTVNYVPPTTTPVPVSSAAVQVIQTSAKYYSNNNQNVYDICNMTYGSLDLMYKLLQDSNFPDIETYPVPNNLFIFDPTKIVNNGTYNFIKSSNIIFTTGGGKPAKFLATDDLSMYITTDEGLLIQIN